MDKNDRVVVIGASAGGVDALRRSASQPPAGFPAPILVVLHIGAYRSRLPEVMSAAGSLKAVGAETGMVPERGTIYVAPSDQHLILDDGRLRLHRGPKEHHARPAINPLFRSAALDVGPRAIGVVLTGMLDDGSAGLRAIQVCGGTAVVQDSDDAAEPSMPRSALAWSLISRRGKRRAGSGAAKGSSWKVDREDAPVHGQVLHAQPTAGRLDAPSGDGGVMLA